MNDSGAAPNWYPDPTEHNELRYWDGKVWTEHISNRGRQGTDPLVANLAPSAATAGSIVEDVPGADATDEKQGMFARMRGERRAKAAGRDEFESTALAAAHGDAAAMQALPEAVAEARNLYRGSQFEKRRWETMAVAVRSVIDDDILSVEEEEHLVELGNILGTDAQAMEQRDRALFEELVIARINAGRLPRLPNPGIMLKRGEEAYGAFDASLMKEVAIRQYQAGTSSVSVPLGGGIRYRVGGVRGRSVVIGSELVAADTGVLVVTSQRSVFTGQAKTLEFRNDKLVGMEQYTDGLRLNVSNRQAASLFKFPTGPSIAAALISASVAHSD
jgi:Protein of unknown function (DUF2510)